MVDVSIVLATKDRAELLDKMLLSLKDAVGEITYEIIVIEGGSSDNTLDVLQKHGIENIIDERESLGEGKHSWPVLYNYGFSKAKGKWAMYASDDIVFSENCIANAISILTDSPDNVSGGVFFYKNVCAELNWDKYGIDFTYGQKLLLNYGLFRLEDFNSVGGLDDQYKFYCADGDLCFKFYEQGKTLIPLPGSFVTHNNVLDVQKKVNFSIADKDIQLYKDRWCHFVDVSDIKPRRLVWQEDKKDAYLLGSESGAYPGIDNFWQALALFACGDSSAAIKIVEDLLLKDPNFPKAKRMLRKIKLREKALGNQTKKDVKVLNTERNALEQLQEFGLVKAENCLRLHLGCGQNHFDDYVNIDYPPSEHTVQTKVAADVFADITQLRFPDCSIDEIRLHHVFEHFNPATSLALLTKWHKFIKPGGILVIETPDFDTSLELYNSVGLDHKSKQVILRHLFGSHEAAWAIHKDAWSGDKFKYVLSSLGFDECEIKKSNWKLTCNITVYAKKTTELTIEELKQKSFDLLFDGLVDLTEESLYLVWCNEYVKTLGCLLDNKAGDLEPQLLFLDRRIEFDPKNYALYVLYASKLLEHDKTKEALSFLEKAISLAPEQENLKQLYNKLKINDK